MESHRFLESREAYRKVYQQNIPFTHWTEHTDEKKIATDQHYTWARRWRLIFLFDRLGRKTFKEVSNVLDAGCGLGFYSYVLSIMGFKVTAIDIDAFLIDDAKKRSLPGIEWKCLEIEEVATLGKMFDAIVCFEVFEHVRDPIVTKDVLMSVLKPKGILLWTAPIGERSIGPWHVRHWTDEMIRDLFKDQDITYMKPTDIGWRVEVTKK